jgi:hypothetical protein
MNELPFRQRLGAPRNDYLPKLRVDQLQYLDGPAHTQTAENELPQFVGRVGRIGDVGDIMEDAF